MLLRPRVALLHQRAQRGRCGVEYVDAMLGDHLPEAAEVREIWNAFEHQRHGAVGERPVNNVGVAGNPADVGGAPVDVARAVVEDVVVCRRDVDEIAAGGVQHPLRLTSAAGSIENEQRGLGVHLRWRALGAGGAECVVPPDVAPRLHDDCAAGAPHHQHVLDARRLRNRRVGVCLHRDIGLGTAHAGVLRDNQLALGIVDARDQAVGRERAEDDGMHRTNPRARQHRNRQFRDHLQVDADAVALADAERLQRIGGLLHFGVQFRVGEALALVGVVALPDDGDRVAVPRLDVAVDAVVAGVELPALEPCDSGRAVVAVAYAVPLARPADALRFPGPESFGVGDRAVVELLIFRKARNVCLFRCCLRRGEYLHHCSHREAAQLRAA